MTKTGVFDRWWNTLASKGICDATGGNKYKRVLRLWVKAECPAKVTEFIRAHANRPLPGMGSLENPPAGSALEGGL